MIPVRDTQPSNSRPLITYFLIAANLLVFMVQLGYGLKNQIFIYHWGFVPAKYTVEEISAHFSIFNHLVSLFSYMFLHGGFFHFAGNMLSLYIFGDNVEDHLGSFRYLGFYIFCGLISGAFHFISNPYSQIPTIGASGAIAGVMGAYFLLYPRSKILTIIPIIIIPWFVEIPAFLFLGFWFLLQFLNAAGQGAGSGIAWWAHIGGFLAGMVLVKLSSRLPETQTDRRIRQFTKKDSTPRLQSIQTSSLTDDFNLYGNIEISSLEAITGTRKLVNIPWGFYNRLYRINVPPGVKNGTTLRLGGMGKEKPGAGKGDMFLKVQIKNVV